MQILSIKDLSKEDIIRYIKRAIEFKNGLKVKLEGSIADVFLEPSTRTLLSFQKAASNLGLDLFHLDIGTSSFKKGETLEDTLLNLKAMGIGAFVIRAKEEGYWEDFQYDLNILNGGDGTKNHPTQALLDAMTIYEHYGTLENLNVAIIGDIKHSRVYHSNKDLLEKFNSKVTNIGPVEFDGNGQHLMDSIGEFDVLNFLRIQHERHEVREGSYEVHDYNKNFGLNSENVELMKEGSIFLHPGPINRGVEITGDLLYDHPKNKILDQVSNGVFIRMALIEDVWKNM